MNDCIHGTDVPIDGASLRQALHQKGINLRYLGHLILSISQSDRKHQLRHITVNSFKIHYIRGDFKLRKRLNHILPSLSEVGIRRDRSALCTAVFQWLHSGISFHLVNL